MTIKPGMRVANIANLGTDPGAARSGTIGGVVYKNGEPLWLTCYHCVWNRHLDWQHFSPTQGNLNVAVKDRNGQYQSIGTILDARRDQYVDIALIKPNVAGDIGIISFIDGIGTPRGHRLLDPTECNHTLLRKRGAATDFAIGVFNGYQESTAFAYGPLGTDVQYLDSLVTIRSLDTEVFSGPGDSGAFILDSNDLVVGILLGADTHRSLFFAINPQFIIKNFGICFTPNSS